MIFDGPVSDPGMKYDTSLHDFVDEDGNLANAERVASAWGMTPEEVEQERQERQEANQGLSSK